MTDATPARRPDPGAAPQPGLDRIEAALQLLARAVRQFHTYPATSPLCADAVMACHDSLKSLPHRDRVSSRVAPHELIVDDARLGAGTVIEHELTRRLFKLRVAALEINHSATPRDLSRFCVDLVEADDLQTTTTTFAARLAEHGVDTIVPTMAQKPVVLDVGVPPANVHDLLDHERRRHVELTAPDAPIDYLYPPDKGWIRLDPTERLTSVSLLDLVVLVDDPAEVAGMLVRLTDDDDGAADASQSALERKYSDVTKLISALDPRLAQVMFGKLARAVLKLEPDNRKNLLQRTILPGLLDGQPDGAVLQDFPDMDLAESVCLLLDLETAAPEVLSAALNRLDLTPDRRAVLAPLIEERMHAKRNGRGAEAIGSGVDRYARQLVRVDAAKGADFSEFAAFDLSMDAHAEAGVLAVRNGIGATDVLATQLLCVSQLVHIEPNPTLVETFLRRGLDLLGALERAGRWPDVTRSLEEYARLADELADRRPDVADAISHALTAFCTPSRLLALTDLLERDADGRRTVEDLVRALGASFVPGFVALMNQTSQQPRARAFVPLLCDLAPKVAPALVAALDACGAAAARASIKVLGHAGTGHEAAIARLVDRHDAQVAREVFRALSRIGTSTAAALVAREIKDGNNERQTLAEDALWHFPPGQAATEVRALLQSREFVLRHPQVAVRLIDRAGHAGVRGLDEALARLERLRFRFWRPRLVQVAMKARELRAR